MDKSTILLFFFILLVLILVSFGITAFCIMRIYKLEERYRKFMKNQKSAISIEELLYRCLEETDSLKQEYAMANNRLTEVENSTSYCVQKITVKRYNVFEDVGSDQSFSVALLDKSNNGVVITGLYTRDGTTTYAKPINNGTCSYVLSLEEKDVLDETIRK